MTPPAVLGSYLSRLRMVIATSLGSFVISLSLSLISRFKSRSTASSGSSSSMILTARKSLMVLIISAESSGAMDASTSDAMGADNFCTINCCSTDVNRSRNLPTSVGSV